MSYLDRIAECNAHQLDRFVRWRAGGRVVGFVRDDRASLLRGPSMPFRPCGAELELVGDDFGELSSKLAAAMAELAERGNAPVARGELYPVAFPVRSEPVCVVDRAQVAWLGVAAAGVHLNGYVHTSAGIEMWIAERSRVKTTFPGMLDNMVAGGQSQGLGLRENVIKECGEEAGIPAGLAARAVAVGVVSYVFEDETGLKPDTMFCYDLELPDDFEPTCVDGEVERYRRMPVAEVAEIVAGSRRFKFNCNLVVIDFLVRHGLVDAEDPEYARLVDGLRQPMCR